MDDSQVWALVPSQGISAAESNEQQRNWDDRMWETKTHTRGFNYDRSREQLNFEVGKGGVIQPIDKSKTIGQRMWESLNARGIDPYKKKHDKRKRIVAEMIFQGSRKLMHRLAFGEQQVDLTRGADNSHITRCKGIEDWAKDIYDYVARKYGEENIIGFYVHCDEVTPHVHCSIIPMTPDNEVSWGYWFGARTREEGSKLFQSLHDEIAEINKKWGMKRGRSIKDTGAKHVSRDEYIRQVSSFEKKIDEHKSELLSIYDEINAAKRKVNAFTTMIDNLNVQKNAIESEINKLRIVLDADPNDSNEDVVKAINDLVGQLEKVKADIQRRYNDLANAEDALAHAKAQLAEVRNKNRQYQTLNSELENKYSERVSAMETKARYHIASVAMSVMSDTLRKLVPTLNTNQLALIDTDILNSFAEKGEEVMECATLLFWGYINEATQYVESHGGAAGPGTGWRGKRDDEDERQFAHRCLAAASKMLPSHTRSRKR